MRNIPDFPLAAVVSLALHAVLFVAPMAWLVAGEPVPLVGRGLTSIEVNLAARPPEVRPPEIVRERRDEPPEPIEKREEPPPRIEPDEIVIPRETDDEPPPPPPTPAPPRKRPEPVEVAPAAPSVSVPRGARRARTIGGAKPTYPEYCRQRGIEGKVTLVIEVLPTGRAKSVVVSKSSGSWRLDRAASEFYLREARYELPRRRGRPVGGSITVTVRFELTDEERRLVAPEPEPGL